MKNASMSDIPNHVAIIMDGNGRWARQRGLPRTAGHRRGAQRIKEIVLEAKKKGVKALSVYAFSTENWNRPRKEIDVLFSYLNRFLDSYRHVLIREDIRLKIIGQRLHFSPEIRRKIRILEHDTRQNKSFTFIIALDYGGRWDIVNAVRNILRDAQSVPFCGSDVDESFFRKYLALGDIPDPELLIRTSGEQRISNFMIWNLAYSEFYFTPIYWPDFDEIQFHKALEAYAKRERRFGGLQVVPAAAAVR